MASITEILSDIHSFAKDQKYSTPYIVGGIPRDTYLGLKDEINDVDITTGDSSVFKLAVGVSEKIREQHPDSKLVEMNDKHIKIVVYGIDIDFSTNYVSPNADKSIGSNMLLELVSRDFTINTLLMTLDFKSISDLTGKAYKDLDKKIIKTCMAPKITLTDNRKRAVRAIYLAAKLDMEIDGGIKDWIKTNPEIMSENTQYTSSKLVSAFQYNLDKTRNTIKELGLLKHIPITNELYPFLKEMQ